MPDLPVIREKLSLETLSTTSSVQSFLIRDFGWPTTSPRYAGDHTQASNPDWEHDPLSSAEARECAMKKMEVSYALYMANMAKPAKERKTKDGWVRNVWNWATRREIAVM